MHASYGAGLGTLLPGLLLLLHTLLGCSSVLQIPAMCCFTRQQAAGGLPSCTATQTVWHEKAESPPGTTFPNISHWPWASCTLCAFTAGHYLAGTMCQLIQACRLLAAEPIGLTC